MAALAVEVTGVDVAVPPAVELNESQAAKGLLAVSTVKAVPPLTAEVTEIVCGLPYGV